MQNPYLAAVRAEHVRRIEERLLKAQHSASLDAYGLPIGLIAAGLWLVHQGWDGAACDGERATGWGPHRYRAYLAGLPAHAVAEEIEGGQRVVDSWGVPTVLELARAA